MSLSTWFIDSMCNIGYKVTIYTNLTVSTNFFHFFLVFIKKNDTFALDFLYQFLIERQNHPSAMPNSRDLIEVHAMLRHAMVTLNVEAGNGREITKYWKGVYMRLALDLSKSRKFRQLVTRQGNGRCPGM